MNLLSSKPYHLILLLELASLVAPIIGQAGRKPAQIFIDASAKNSSPNPMAQDQAQPSTPPRSKQASSIQPILREGIKVTINEHSLKYAKLENLLSTLDRVTYALSKPMVLINAFRLVAQAALSIVMTASANRKSHKRRSRADGADRHGHLWHMSAHDLDEMVDVMTRLMY